MFISDRLLAKIKLVILAFFGCLFVVGFVFSLLIARTIWIEDYCTRYSREKLGDRWYEPIPTTLTYQEYYKATGRKDYFGADYTEANLGWFEVFKCENRLN